MLTTGMLQVNRIKISEECGTQNIQHDKGSIFIGVKVSELLDMILRIFNLKVSGQECF